MSQRNSDHPDQSSNQRNDNISDKEKVRNAQSNKASQIVYWIIGILLVLLVIIGLMGYRYVKTSLQPVDRNDQHQIQVKIPIGSTNKEIADRLQNQKVIRSATVFDYYIRTHNYTDFQAGYYMFKPSMTMSQIITKLQQGGSANKIRPIKAKVLVKEGVTIDEIGDVIQKKTPYSKKEFLALMNDQAFMDQLDKKYPQLLDSSMASKGVRYHLEGYLFPATYNLYKGMSLKSLITSMVAKSNTVLKPYYTQIDQKGLTVQQVMTLASLVEREGVTENDRRKISGVFFNRIDADMPLQSDISVMYALKTHKDKLSLKDVKVDSPYNLYINSGYGPGPFNTPSLGSIQAVLNPSDRNQGYLYFVADLKTGKVYYSHTLDEHETKNAKLGQ